MLDVARGMHGRRGLHRGDGFLVVDVRGTGMLRLLAQPAGALRLSRRYRSRTTRASSQTGSSAS